MSIESLKSKKSPTSFRSLPEISHYVSWAVPTSSLYQSLGLGLFETLLRFANKPDILQPIKAYIGSINPKVSQFASSFQKQQELSTFFYLYEFMLNSQYSIQQRFQSLYECVEGDPLYSAALDYGTRLVLCTMLGGNDQRQRDIMNGQDRADIQQVLLVFAETFKVKLIVVQQNEDKKEFYKAVPGVYPVIYIYTDGQSYYVLYAKEMIEIEMNANFSEGCLGKEPLVFTISQEIKVNFVENDCKKDQCCNELPRVVSKEQGVASMQQGIRQEVLDLIEEMATALVKHQIYDLETIKAIEKVRNLVPELLRLKNLSEVSKIVEKPNSAAGNQLIRQFTNEGNRVNPGSSANPNFNQRSPSFPSEVQRPPDTANFKPNLPDAPNLNQKPPDAPNFNQRPPEVPIFNQRSPDGPHFNQRSPERLPDPPQNLNQRLPNTPQTFYQKPPDAPNFNQKPPDAPIFNQRSPDPPQNFSQKPPEVPQPFPQRFPEIPQHPNQRFPNNPQPFNQRPLEAPQNLNQRTPDMPQSLNQRPPEVPQNVIQRYPDLPQNFNQILPNVPQYFNQRPLDVPQNFNQRAPDVSQNSKQRVPDAPQNFNQRLPDVPQNFSQRVPDVPQNYNQRIPDAAQNFNQRSPEPINFNQRPPQNVSDFSNNQAKNPPYNVPPNNALRNDKPVSPQKVFQQEAQIVCEACHIPRDASVYEIRCSTCNICPACRVNSAQCFKCDRFYSEYELQVIPIYAESLKINR